MYGVFRSALEKTLSIFGLGLVRKSDLERMKQIDVSLESKEIDFEIIQKLQVNVRQAYAKARTNSTSALRQDLFALLATGFKHHGYFVEFGACDGKFVSNSFLLEKEFKWEGILCEPARIWHKDLVKNRSALISKKMVWSTSGCRVQFSEYVSPGLSKITSGDKKSSPARIKKSYEVESISLLDLLKENNAPREIDFISIDTEGSEYEILVKFDFSKYTVSAFAIEHNYETSEHLVHDLLEKNGYMKVLSKMSRYEGWYVHNSKVPVFTQCFVNGDIT